MIQDTLIPVPAAPLPNAPHSPITHTPPYPVVKLSPYHAQLTPPRYSQMRFPISTSSARASISKILQAISSTTTPQTPLEHKHYAAPPNTAWVASSKKSHPKKPTHVAPKALAFCAATVRPSAILVQTPHGPILPAPICVRQDWVKFPGSKCTLCMA